MARFSIEDTLFELASFKAMQVRLGRTTALGAWVECGRIAQFHWKKKNLIPKDEIRFIDNHLELLEFGFLQERDDGYYFRGSEENFLWLTERIEAASKGGRASAKRPRDEKGRLLSFDSPSKHQANTKQDPSASSPLTPSLKSGAALALESQSSNLDTLTYSLFPKSKNKNLATLGETSLEVIPKKTEIKNPVGYFIGAYRKAFHEKYGTDPDVRGKVQGQIKALLKDYPVDKAITLMQAFLQMEGKAGWFNTKGHDIGTFLENINPISIALAKGKEGESINWKKVWSELGEKHAAS